MELELKKNIKMGNTTINRTWNPKSEYAKKLQDPRWQRKRLEVLQRDNFQCQLCDATNSTLHVHHIYYCSYNPWDSELDHLITLCSDCHEQEDFDSKKEISEFISLLKSNGFMSYDFNNLRRILSSENAMSFFKGDSSNEKYKMLHLFIRDSKSLDFVKKRCGEISLEKKSEAIIRESEHNDNRNDFLDIFKD